MVKICCITYKKLDDMVRKAIEKIQDEELSITIVEGLREGIVDKVQNEITNGAEVLLAGGANATIVEKNFNLPVLHYKISDFDYLTAIHKGYQLGERAAIVTYQNGISEKLLKYLDSQEQPIQNIIYEDTQELETELEQADVNVIIGASHAMEVGQKLGKKVVLIYPGIQSIVETIYDARDMAVAKRKSEAKNQYTDTVMRYTTNGIFLIDKQKKIISCNAAIKDILGLHSKAVLDQNIDSVIENWCDEEFWEESIREKNYILNYNNREILEKVIKIGHSLGVFEGAVIIFSKLNDIKKAQMEHEQKEREARRQKGFEAKKHFNHIIGKSYGIKACIEDAKIFSKSDSSVLIYGETGVGKEVFAQSIHNESRRANGPFIAVNCGALTESLLEAELFGYDEGAFTGSRKGGKKGFFELAAGGTVFLDEIGEISPLMQTRLLRVLQEHEIMKVGGERIISVDVRVIAATNRDLEHSVHEVFRRDLLYRLNVLELHIPPLRERDMDAVLLFEGFYRQRADALKVDTTIPEQVKELIQLYTWHGNIREMQNVSERYCLYVEQGTRMEKEFLSRCMIKAIGEEKIRKAILEKHHYNGSDIDMGLVMDLKHILSYSREKIADILGSSRTTIWRLMKKDEENVSKKR